MECSGCGAATAPNHLTCEFCGTTLAVIGSNEDEEKALLELMATAGKIATEHSEDYGAVQQLSAFWKVTFTPSSPQLAIKMLMQVMTPIGTDGSGCPKDMNAGLFAKADSLLLSLKMADDQSCASKATVLTEELEKKRAWVDDWKNCFPANARVLTSAGYRELGDLEAGDTVLSYTHSGQLAEERITRKVSYGRSKIYCLQLEGERSPIRTTSHHSFKTEQGWKQAAQLKIGDALIVLDAQGNAQQVRVTDFSTEASEPVFNLHTTGAHNFIVEGAVAHNFTEFRILRTWLHRAFVDPWYGSWAPRQTSAALKR
ncbi:MAG TPA: hypothetical protein EYN66_04585 [Myxococcales bacterium]|nr:hypothetical protein [Myxococcales bacterium]